MDVSSLLAKIKADLEGAAEPEYLQPVRKTQLLEYLSNKEPTWVVVHLYYSWVKENGFPLETSPDKTVIFHGHEEGEGCAAPKFCHELGYKPIGAEHPAFIKNFYKKWEQLK